MSTPLTLRHTPARTLGALLLLAAAACTDRPTEPTAPLRPAALFGFNPSELRIDDVTVTEPDDFGTATAVFTVTLSGTHGMVNVLYSTTGGTALASPNGCGASAFVDYVGANARTVTFLPGESSKQIPVTICGDPTVEPDETFFLELTPLATSAEVQVMDGRGRATIVNDDEPTRLRIDGTVVTEGDQGFTTGSVRIVAEGPRTGDVTVFVSTSDIPGSATGGSCGTGNADYGAFAQLIPVTLPASVNAAQVAVRVCGDTLEEMADEQFEVRLVGASAGAVIEDGTAVVTIRSDDELRASLVIEDAQPVSEPSASLPPLPGTGKAVFRVLRLGQSPTEPVTVQWTTVAGSASAGQVCRFSLGPTLQAGDFIEQSGTLTFLPGGPFVQTIEISVCGDFVSGEPTETFFVRLSNPSPNARLLRLSGTGTIQ